MKAVTLGLVIFEMVPMNKISELLFMVGQIKPTGWSSWSSVTNNLTMRLMLSQKCQTVFFDLKENNLKDEDQLVCFANVHVVNFHITAASLNFSMGTIHD